MDIRENPASLGKFGCLITTAIVFLIVAICIGNAGQQSLVDPSEKCADLNTLLDLSKITIKENIFYWWNSEYDVNEEKLNIVQKCLSPWLYTEYFISKNSSQIVNYVKEGFMGYTSYVNDCHGSKIAKIQEFYPFGTVPESSSPLSKYRLFFNITSPDESEVYGYYAVDSITAIDWKIVDTQGNIVVNATKNSTLSLTTNFEILDNKNPASDFRIYSMVYTIAKAKAKGRDTCNKIKFSTYCFMVLFFILSFGLVILYFYLKNTRQNSANNLISGGNINESSSQSRQIQN
jgi:hypothetical protein